MDSGFCIRQHTFNVTFVWEEPVDAVSSYRFGQPNVFYNLKTLVELQACFMVSC